MSAILFYNLQSRKEFAEGKMLYLDDKDGFDEDFCASTRPGDELRVLQAREPGIPLFELRYATCEVKKADYSGIEAQIISEISLGELIKKMPLQDNFNTSTLMQWTQSYISRAGNDQSLLDKSSEKLPFNLPARSILEGARLRGEMLVEHYNNSYNTLHVQYMASPDAFRILYIRNDREWYNILYDLFHPRDLFGEIEKHYHNARTEAEKEYWNYFLQ